MISFMCRSLHAQHLSRSAEHRQTRTRYCSLTFIVVYVTMSKAIQRAGLVECDGPILCRRYRTQKSRCEEQKHTPR